MTIRPADLRLPPEASRIDHWTLAAWRFWDDWLRSAMRLARSVAVGLVVVATAAWFVFDGSQRGALGAAVSGAIVAGVVSGMAIGRSGSGERTRRSVGQIVLAVLIGGPLGLFMLWIGLMLALVVLTFVVTPVVNYPALVIVVIPGALAAGWAIRKLRDRRNARYP